MRIKIEDINKSYVDELTTSQARRLRVVVAEKTAQLLTVIVEEAGLSRESEEELEIISGLSVRTIAVNKRNLEELLDFFYPINFKDSRFDSTIYTGDADSFLHTLITEAKHIGSSDIHIEAYEDNCRVRLRVDGLLIPKYIIDKSSYPSLINKIKIISNLDISEKRLPQDGRILFSFRGVKLDIRVSILPAMFGEKIVLRLLNNNAGETTIDSLGLDKVDKANYLNGVRKPNGIILISGPTGSGKTTTLYATLKLLNTTTRNILTIEDPIEYTLPGINQVQLKESIGLTFAAALRNFMRQDPDVIMLGEIRDPETAAIAIRAALTGHLVLSTIHTNSAWATISRLLDMGIQPFLLATTLNTTVAQRLIRVLCPKCKLKKPLDHALFPKYFSLYRPIVNHHVPQGCPDCFGTGYKGRKAVYEVIPIDSELSELIQLKATNAKHHLQQKGIKTLSENAFEMLENGTTSLEEIYSLLSN